MTLRIAIHRDDTRLVSGRRQSFSKRWQELAGSHDVEIELVDAYSPGLFEKLRRCDGFMWHFCNSPDNSDIGKRLVLSLAHGLKIPVYPSWKTCWFFEDKNAQRYLLDAAGIPMPATWVFWTLRRAEEFAEQATYPIVAKLSFGITSTNVRLIRNREEAMELINKAFQHGMVSMPRNLSPTWAETYLERMKDAVRVLRGRRLGDHASFGPVQRGCVQFQEFIPNNAFDTRITVIGNRAFAFRRHNRPGDFRASGSGNIDWSPDGISQSAIELAFSAARSLQGQVLTLDVLFRGEQPVVVEISHYYEAWAVHRCSGHWQIGKHFRDMTWVSGQMRPEDAIFQDFVQVLGQTSKTHTTQT